jgi:ATP-dependent protease ClpP protease subunit
VNQSVPPIKCRVREDAGVTRVDVYDDIGGDGEGGWFSGLTAKDFSAQLVSVAGPLDVHINSAGGSVPDGIAIANAVRAHRGRKRTIVDGMAASIASIIMQAGDERIVEPGSMVMIHDASTIVGGTQADLQKTADALGKHSDNLAKQYADRAGGTAEQWRGSIGTVEIYDTEGKPAKSAGGRD